MNCNVRSGVRVITVLSAAILMIGGAALLSIAAADTVAVNVHNGLTGDPIEGAFVMVGPSADIPFANNWLWTDAAGGVLFDNPAISGPQTVTAASEGFAHSTIFDAVLTEITVSLYPTIVDSSMAGRKTRVEGTVSNISNSNNDGFLDIALVLPAVSTSDAVMGDLIPFSFGNEIVNFPVVGDVELPENSYLPSQTEFFIMTFSKSPWRIDLPGLRTHTFTSIAGRISTDDLINGASLEDFVIREVGVERDIYVGGPMNVTINSDLNLSAGLTANLSGVPAGSDLILTSGAQIPSSGHDLLVTYDLKQTNIDLASSVQMVSRTPSGDMSDATNVVVARYNDSSASLSYEAGIIDRSGFTLPYVANFDNWQGIPEIEMVGSSFSWSDPSIPGVSPPPTWTRSNIGLRPVVAGDTSVPVTREWHLYARAGAGGFDLPILPPEAPGAAGGLTNPVETAENDQLYWQFWAANPPDDPEDVANGFIEGGTHWSWRWIPIEYNSASVDDDPRPQVSDFDLTLAAYPNPGRQMIDLSWQSALAGSGRLEIISPEGRVLRSEIISLGAGSARWHGEDANGASVPSGIYWARISTNQQSIQRKPLVWIR